ncbi:MAG TPA: DUF748 domain-containing protein [Opitutaceae bacterium]
MAQNNFCRYRWLIAAVGLFVVYLLVGFLVLPPIVRGQIEKQAGAVLDRAVGVGKVQMNPLVFSVSVDGLRVIDHDGADLASWQRAYVNFDPLTSLLRWEWHVKQVELVEPRQRVVIDKEGRLNIADLLEPGAEETAAETDPVEKRVSLPAIGLGRLFIQDWSVSLADESLREPFATVVGPMTFELSNLTTRADEESPYSLRGTTDTGETFGWSGTMSVAPLGSQGLIEFNGVSLPKHAPLAGNAHRSDVRAGTVSLSTRYEVALGDSPVIRLADTRVTVDGLALGFPGAAEPSVRLAKLEVVMPAADAMARTAQVERITVAGLDARAERRANGTIDLMDWAPSPPEEPGREIPPADASDGDGGPAPSVLIGRIEMSDGRVQVTDRTNPRPAVMLLDQIAVTATNAGTDLDREVGVEATMRWDEGGTIAIDGTVRPFPLAAVFDVSLAGLELSPLEPFVEPHANVRIRDGLLTVVGHADIALDSNGPLTLTWKGDVAIDSLDTEDGWLESPLVGWSSLALKDIKATLEPMEFAAGEIAIVEPLANLSIAKDGTINVMAALRRESPDFAAAEIEPVAEADGRSEAAPEPAPAAGTSETVAEATNQPLPFGARVDLITITGGVVRVRDESVGGGFATELRDFTGTIKGLSSENEARADVDLSANLDGRAPLRIAGSINPLAKDKHSDITIEFSNIDLPSFSPYSGQFIGQKIEKGKLNLDLGYKVSQNVLDGENRVILDEFYLGEKVESPNAIRLPLGLALALLRDRQGRIDLDVPVSGNLDDPSFQYGSVVWKTFGNIILKAATSPFKMLGSILGGGAQEVDLSHIDFGPASTEAGEDARRKLDLLAKALFERPALRLEIIAPPSPAGDRPGLLEERLAALLRAEKAAQRAATAATTGDAPAPMGEGRVVVAPGETEALLRVAFVRLFPEEAARAVDPGATPAQEGRDVESSVAFASAEGDGGSNEEENPSFIVRFLRRLFRGDERKAETSESVAAREKPAAAETAPPGAAEPPPLTIAEMQERVADSIELTDADFQALSAARARSIRERILAGGQVEPERVIVSDSVAIPEDASMPSEGARVFFGLE